MERQVYVYDYVEVPYGEVVDLLTSLPDSILQGATDEAATHADEIVTNLHVQIGRFDVGRDISLQLGEPEPRGRWAVVFPLTWTAADSPAFFPSLDARLEVAILSTQPPITQVSLIADYEPPFGPVGAVGDVLIGHRVAQATVHGFVQDVVERLERAYAEHPTEKPALAD